jgi:hypothetical protein
LVWPAGLLLGLVALLARPLLTGLPALLARPLLGLLRLPALLVAPLLALAHRFLLPNKFFLDGRLAAECIEYMARAGGWPPRSDAAFATKP